MSISKIQPGMSFSRNFKVRPEWAADRMGSGHVPVLSTAALVLAMENTAASSILPYLEEGTTSVGSRVEIVHLYPTPVGEFFTIDLVVVKVEKSRIDFTMTSRDEHRVISTGFHRRHVVDTAKFLEKIYQEDGPAAVGGENPAGGGDPAGVGIDLGGTAAVGGEIAVVDGNGDGGFPTSEYPVVRGEPEAGAAVHRKDLDSDDFNDNDTIF